MTSVDLKDAFFTVPVLKSYQTFFKFKCFKGFYKFIASPNGYFEAMRIYCLWIPQTRRLPFDHI